MPPLSNHTIANQYDAHEWALRVDLAAAFRLAVYFDWHESVGNHFSAAVSADGKAFLLNPKWVHFSTIKASDLLLLNADDENVMQDTNAPDTTAWCIHGSLHAKAAHAKVVLHCHPPYITALCGLKDPSIKPIDQTTAKYFNRVAIDLEFGGLADESDEGLRIAKALGSKNIMMMGNHGVTVVGQTVAEAFEELYFLERAAKTLVLAYSTGQPLNVMPDQLAEHTAQGWGPFTKGLAENHFAYLKTMLDNDDDSYRQ